MGLLLTDCGVIQGKYPNETEGWNCGAGANFQNFSLAKRTDFGSKVLK